MASTADQPHTPVVKYSEFTLSGSIAGGGTGTPQQQAPSIRSSELEYFEQIGGGCFGKVYRGKCRGKIVAIKKLLKQELDEKALTDFVKEVEIMSHLRHPNCLLFMGACTEPGHMAIVTEFMPKGSIVSIIRNNPTLSLYRRLLMARDTALGMNWLHCSVPQIIHRDLKPSNLLIDENWNLKVCDFGLSAVKPVGIDKLQDKDSIPGTPLWMAPEVMLGRPLDEKSDVYSFGIVVWEILTGVEPFSQYTSYPVFKKAICVKNERPPIRPDFHPAVVPLLEQCWDKDPAKRPSFAQILTMLDNIIIDCAISDKIGNTFWRENFFGKMDVPWDTFSVKFADALKVPPATNELNFKCLKAIVADKSEEPGSNAESFVVNIEKFGNVLNWLGPIEYIQTEQKGKTLQTSPLLEEIKALMSQPWFHGAITKEEAEAILAGQAKCTYLVRLSSTEPGGFTISKVTKDSKINHQRIHHVPGTQKFVVHINSSKGNKTIEHEARGGLLQLMKKVEGDLNLKTPCPGSKFRALFINADIQGYLTTDY